MENIKYKAKGLNGKWLFGVPTYDMLYMFEEFNTDSPDNYLIDKETICRYVGITDRNGIEIYSNDIVKICKSYGYGFLPKGSDAVVTWSDTELCYFLNGKYRLTKNKCVEVVGNICDITDSNLR